MHSLTVAIATLVLVVGRAGAERPAPEWTSVETLGLRLVNRSGEEVERAHPGLNLPGKRYVVIAGLESPVLVEDGPLTAQDIVVKFDGKSVSSLEEIEAILAGLTLPKDIRIDFLDLVPGTKSKTKTKRESVTIRAKKPPSKPATVPPSGAPSTPPSDLPSNPFGDPEVGPGSASGGAEAPSAPKPVVTVEYDRFKDRTMMGTSDQLLQDIEFAPPKFEVSANAMFPGERWSVRPSVSLVIDSRDDRWRFLEADRTLYLIIDDGEPVTLEKPHYSNSIMDGPNLCWEYMSWALPEGLIAKLKVAKKVECKLWIVEFRFPPGFGESLAEFDRKLDSLSNAVAPPSNP